MFNKEIKSILELISAFPTEQSCIDHLEQLRWNGNVVSPFDSASKVYNCKGNKYKCKDTGKYFNVKTGTLFDNTKIELQKWFLAIWIVTSHKKGISSLQLSRDINITQKSAWFMNHRIRNCFGIKERKEQLDGNVEVDATFVGGKMKNKHKEARETFRGTTGGTTHMTTVLGLLKRDKGVTTQIINTEDQVSVTPPILKIVDRKATLITDGQGAYRHMKHFFKNHQIINHAQNEYARGIYHTNSVENFWSLLKRGIVGIYHYVSPKHLQKYCDEFAFRYNTRKNTETSRFNLLLANCTYRLTYKELIND